MKKQVLLILALMALLVAPTATAVDTMATVSNPLEFFYSWVASLWDAWTVSEGDRSPSGESAIGNEDPGLPSIGPWLDPHG